MCLALILVSNFAFPPLAADTQNQANYFGTNPKRQKKVGPLPEAVSYVANLRRVSSLIAMVVESAG